MQLNTHSIVACACLSSFFSIMGHIWIGLLILFLMLCCVSIEIYQIWQRCAERKRRIAALASRRMRRGGTC